MLILDDLLFRIPVQIGKEVLNEITERAEKEMGHYSSTEEVLSELKSLQVSLDLGEITEEEYDEKEKLLLDELERLQ